ncbi:flavonoid 3',5'-hydroxylase 1-like [Triticum urartu]|uniref:Flavonoid 3',5'-hydroxylase n=1 Tax=Triticum urartu TaxID=4572 RepID=A0A8R7UQ84_TRIUA|nr:flavonoid 3',5'-hydroxylase 1-like [Triticum urartu]XP_048538421.1 flavonoid 3',5'-hydroxylase 1-like [Triticum urartu]
MQVTAVCTDPFVICCTFMCLLLHLALRSLNPNSASGRRLPPGPRGVPVLGALPLIGPAPHSGLLTLARKYGPVMYLRMGTCGVVVASSPSAARTFLKALDERFANRPAVASAEDMSYGCQNMVFANYGPKWKLMRKLSSVHLLGARAVADWAAVRRDEAGCTLRAVLEAAEAERPVVVPEMLVCALANIVGRITVSKRVFDTQGDESNTYKEMIVSLLTGTGLFNISDFVPALSWLDLQGVQAKLRRIHIQFDGLVTKLLAEHAATAEDRLREGRLDFVDKLRAINDEEGGEIITEVNIKGLITDMFTAGTDTSSIIVEWAMAEMIKSPSIMAHAQEEMDRVIGRDRRLEESDIANLPYLQAICNEAMRLHPSTPLSLPHFSFEECEVDGHHVPANTRLIINIWAIGRDPAAWEDPLEFRPERFLSGPAAKIDPMGNNFELIPFGAGRRICAGKLAGMVFVQYFLGMLVHAFEWRLPDGEDKVDMAETFGLALPKTVPLKAVVKPRLVPAAYT